MSNQVKMKEIRQYPDFVLFVVYIVFVKSIFCRFTVPGGYDKLVALLPFISNTFQI